MTQPHTVTGRVASATKHEFVFHIHDIPVFFFKQGMIIVSFRMIGNFRTASLSSCVLIAACIAVSIFKVLEFCRTKGSFSATSAFLFPIIDLLKISSFRAIL